MKNQSLKDIATDSAEYAIARDIEESNIHAKSIHRWLIVAQKLFPKISIKDGKKRLRESLKQRSPRLQAGQAVVIGKIVKPFHYLNFIHDELLGSFDGIELEEIAVAFMFKIKNKLNEKNMEVVITKTNQMYGYNPPTMIAGALPDLAAKREELMLKLAQTFQEYQAIDQSMKILQG